MLFLLWLVAVILVVSGIVFWSAARSGWASCSSSSVCWSAREA